jgi:hypothetical protein
MASVQVEVGKLLNEPPQPVRTGYDFKGWYTDAGCTECYIFSTPVTKDFTLYGKWEEKPVANPVVESTSLAVEVWPNPMDTELWLRGEEPLEMVEVYTVMGRLVYSRRDVEATTLKVLVSGWSAGVYLVRVLSGDGVIVRSVLKR